MKSLLAGSRGCLFGLFYLILTGCNSHQYHDQAKRYLALTEGTLIAHGVCRDNADCRRRNIIFFESGELSLGVLSWGGISVYLYETQDEVLVEELVQRFRELHEESDEPRVELMVFSSKHGEPQHLFRKYSIN